MTFGTAALLSRRLDLVTLVLVATSVLACAEIREPVRRPQCLDFQSNVQPILATACGSCHSGETPAGDFLVDSYRDVVSPGADGGLRVVAGDPDSDLLVRAGGSQGHPLAGAEARTLLDRWVVDCDVSYFANDLVHPLGWVNPRDPAWHGAALAQNGWNFATCAECHGDGSDPAGGKSGRSCTSCHAQGPTACNTCHGNTESAAPPRDRQGGVLVINQGVGAHRSHVLGGPTLGLQLDCSECHLTPVDWRDPGHVFLADGSLDPPRAEVVFGTLAQKSLEGFESRRTAAPLYNPATGACSNGYCHGGVLGDALANPVAWTMTPAEAPRCDRCHGLPPSTHPVTWAVSECATCHGRVVDSALTLVDPSLHIDGKLTLGNGAETCAACHGSSANAAPPSGVSGETARTSLAVGAHQAHVQAGSLRGPIPCSDCHTTPAGATFYEQVIATGHLDTRLPAEVFPLGFGGLAAADGAAPAFDRGQGTCGNVYCHGAGALLEQDVSPAVERVKSWIAPDAALCGTCHGIPPQDGNPVHAGVTIWDCATCHAASISPDGEILFDPTGESAHIDGVSP